MENLATLDRLEHQRWLLNNNLVSDEIKDNLFIYGHILHTNVRYVDLDIDFTGKIITYTIFFDTKELSKINKFNELSKSNSIIGLWRLKRLLKKEGNLDFQSILNRCVRDYCGNNWSASMNLKNVKEYKNGFDAQPDAGNSGDNK